MKKFICLFFLILIGFPFHLRAQDGGDSHKLDSLDRRASVLLSETLTAPLSLPMPAPILEMAALGFDGCLPWYMGTYGPSWKLHEGFNAQLGMSVTAGWGKHAPSGVGFGQTANLAYALPLGKRFSAAGGVYMQNMDWGNFHQRDVGISAVLHFKVNDVVSLYGYGTKSLMSNNKYVPLNPFYVDRFRDRIGAMMEFKLGENAKISVSVERGSGDYSGFPIYDGSSVFDQGRREWGSRVDSPRM